MSDPKQARSLIEAAARDIRTVRLMASNFDFPDENFGFNVQQGAGVLNLVHKRTAGSGQPAVLLCTSRG